MVLFFDWCFLVCSTHVVDYDWLIDACAHFNFLQKQKLHCLGFERARAAPSANWEKESGRSCFARSEEVGAALKEKHKDRKVAARKSIEWIKTLLICVTKQEQVGITNTRGQNFAYIEVDEIIIFFLKYVPQLFTAGFEKFVYRDRTSFSKQKVQGKTVHNVAIEDECIFSSWKECVKINLRRSCISAEAECCLCFTIFKPFFLSFSIQLKTLPAQFSFRMLSLSHTTKTWFQEPGDR